MKVCHSKFNNLFNIFNRKTSKRRVNIDKHNEVVSPVAEKMIDDFLRYDAAFFTDLRYDDSTQNVRAAKENITIDRLM